MDGWNRTFTHTHAHTHTTCHHACSGLAAVLCVQVFGMKWVELRQTAQKSYILLNVLKRKEREELINWCVTSGWIPSLLPLMPTTVLCHFFVYFACRESSAPQMGLIFVILSLIMMEQTPISEGFEGRRGWAEDRRGEGRVRRGEERRGEGGVLLVILLIRLLFNLPDSLWGLLKELNLFKEYVHLHMHM